MADQQGDTELPKQSYKEYLNRINVSPRTIWRLFGGGIFEIGEPKTTKNTVSKQITPLVNREDFKEYVQGHGISEDSVRKAIESHQIQPGGTFLKPPKLDTLELVNKMIVNDLEIISGNTEKEQQLKDVLEDVPQLNDSEQKKDERRLKQLRLLRDQFPDVWQTLHGGTDTTPEESLTQERNQGSQKPAPEDIPQ